MKIINVNLHRWFFAVIVILVMISCGKQIPLVGSGNTESAPSGMNMVPSEVTPISETPLAPTFTSGPTLTSTVTRTLIPSRTPFPTPARYFETSGTVHFSFFPPYEWITRQWQGSPYIAWEWWRSKYRAFSIGFFWEHYDGSAKSYAKDIVQSLVSGAYNDPRTEYELISEGVFSTDAKVDAYKIIYTSNDDIETLCFYYIHYYFYRDGNIIDALFLRDELWGSARDPLVDNSMKTFRFEE